MNKFKTGKYAGKSFDDIINENGIDLQNIVTSNLIVYNKFKSYYIEKLEAMPQKFSDNIKKILEDTIKLEESSRRSSRQTQNVVSSGSDAVPELENELVYLQKEMDKLDNQLQPSQATSMVGNFASATKKFFNRN